MSGFGVFKFYKCKFFESAFCDTSNVIAHNNNNDNNYRVYVNSM